MTPDSLRIDASPEQSVSIVASATFANKTSHSRKHFVFASATNCDGRHSWPAKPLMKDALARGVKARVGVFEATTATTVF